MRPLQCHQCCFLRVESPKASVPKIRLPAPATEFVQISAGLAFRNTGQAMPQDQLMFHRVLDGGKVTGRGVVRDGQQGGHCGVWRGLKPREALGWF